MPKRQVNLEVRNSKVIVKYDDKIINRLDYKEAIEAGGDIADLAERQLSHISASEDVEGDSNEDTVAKESEIDTHTDSEDQTENGIDTGTTEGRPDGTVQSTVDEGQSQAAPEHKSSTTDSAHESTIDMAGIFDDWRHQNAELLSAKVKADKYQPIDVEKAVKQAQSVVNISSPNDNGYIIPLFDIDKPTPTNKYVLFKPKKEQIAWFDPEFGINGIERSETYETIGTTKIGQRLRFWLPSHRQTHETGIDETELPSRKVRPSDSLSNTERESFFNNLKQFVKSEREAERQSSWKAYSEADLDSHIYRNRVSGPFMHVGKDSTSNGGPTFRFQMAEDEEDSGELDLRSDESLFEGNYCILDIVSNNQQFPIEVELIAVGDQALTLQPVWNKTSQQTSVKRILDNAETEIWLYNLLNPVPFDRRLSAIAAVQQDQSKSQLLTGNRPVEYGVNKFSLPESEIDLNTYQKTGLVWADAANDVVCIHGPPGTGKTRTLTAYVEQAARRGQSILIAAHSNQAVDNLLVGDSTVDSIEDGTLHAIAQKSSTNISIARVGSNSRNRVVQSNYMDNSTSSADIVASTTSGAAQFDPDTFDVTVLDEATQASRPATAIVLNCARKLVLAGDHKQLPPYCADESMQEEDMHISLFEYLLNRYREDISVQLQKQYRMNDEIAQFPNETFYDGQLKTADINKNWTVSDLKPLIGIDIEGDEQRQTKGNSFYNRREAEAVAKQVKLLAQSGLQTEDIGVITAYSGQIGIIGNRINQLDIVNPHRVSVDTVDSFQGGEREAIVVSFVRSNSEGHSGFLEFPEEGPRRLNVALTRARKRLVLVGDWETLGTVAPHRSPDTSCANIYSKLETRIRSADRML